MNIDSHKKYDVIIIGAGIGGLICGSYLAKKKIRVLIIEKHYQAGGCCTSFRRNGFTFDSGAHLFGSCGHRQMLGIFLSHLGIKNNFLKLDPTDILHFPDETITISSDLDQYIDYLCQEFPSEADNIKLFFKEISRMLYHERRMPVLAKYQNSKYIDFLNDFFTTAKLKTILSSQGAYLATEPAELSTIAMGLMLNSYLKDGSYYPLGGVQSFINSVVENYVSSGGVLKLMASVNKLIIKGNMVKGVVLANGDEYYADQVISNIDATKTFLELVGEEHLSKDFLEKIKSIKKSGSYFCDYIGVDLEPEKLKHIRGWHFKTSDMTKEFYDAIYVFVPTLHDKNTAPSNKSVIEVFRVWPKEDRDFAQTKKRMQKESLERLRELAPDAIERIMVRESATPKTIERYTGNSEGAVVGWELSPDNIFNKRLDHITPVGNLFLVGHWTNPSGGIASAALSGFILSQQLLSKRTSKV